MPIRVALAAAALLAGISAAAAQSAAPSANEFASKAAMAGMFEVNTSRIALKSSSNQQVRKFAQQMIKDHGSAGKKLQATAKELKIELPTAMDDAQTHMVNELKGKRGTDFDKAYVSDQSRAHDEAVALFTSYSKSGDQPKLKSFAAKTLPVLKQHQEHAKALEKTLK